MQETRENGIWILEDDEGNVLRVPYVNLGGPIYLNGDLLPSGKLWSMLVDAGIKGEKLPRKEIMEEALRAQIYIQRIESSLLLTPVAPKGSQHVHGDVYLISNHQRQRPLVERFNLTIGKIKAQGINGPMVQQLLDAAELLGLQPVGGQDNKYYFSKNPEEVFDALGTRDWVRIGVFLKRAGSSSVQLDLTCGN